MMVAREQNMYLCKGGSLSTCTLEGVYAIVYGWSLSHCAQMFTTACYSWTCVRIDIDIILARIVSIVIFN